MRRCCDWLNVSEVVCEVSCWRLLAGWCSTVGRQAETDSDQIEILTEKMLYHAGEIANTPKYLNLALYLHQLGYVNHLDVFYLHVNWAKNLFWLYFLMWFSTSKCRRKCAVFKINPCQVMKSGYCIIVWNRRDLGAS